MKKIISTDQAPAAIGPYSQAVKANGFVFFSGQIPLTPDGSLVEGGITEQTTQVLKNLSAVVEAAGLTLQDICKTTVLLEDMNDFAAMNEVYAHYFTEQYPARAAFQVSRLPKDVKVEIEAIACVPNQP